MWSPLLAFNGAGASHKFSIILPLHVQSTRDVALAVALARCDAAATAAAAPGGGGSLAAYDELRAASRLMATHRVGPTLLAEVQGAMQVRKGQLLSVMSLLC